MVDCRHLSRQSDGGELSGKPGCFLREAPGPEFGYEGSHRAIGREFKVVPSAPVINPENYFTNRSTL